MPAGYYVIVRLGRMLPGDPLLTLRLPSILGYLLTLLGSYWFVSKRLPSSAGLAAVLLLTLSPFRECTLEARSYSLLVGFLAIAAVCWQRIGEKRFMTALFALFLALAVSCHHLAVVTISCFGIAELASTLLWRRIRLRVWAACLFAALPFFMSLPLLLHYRDVFGKNFWAQPSWSMAHLTYGDYLGTRRHTRFGSDPFLYSDGWRLADAWHPATPGRHRVHPARDRPGRRLSALPCRAGCARQAARVRLHVSIRMAGHPRAGLWNTVFASKYLAQIAFRLSAGGAADRLRGSRRRQFRMPRNGDTALVDERWARLAQLSSSEPGVPVEIGNPMAYLEADEYAPPELRDRLGMVVNSDIATGLGWSDTPDKTNRLLAQFIPLRVESLAKFQLAHPKFILYSGGDWLTQYLVENGYHLFLLAEDNDGSSLYVAERSEH